MLQAGSYGGTRSQRSRHRFGFYVHRKRPIGELLPWDHVNVKKGRAYLEKEQERSLIQLSVMAEAVGPDYWLRRIDMTIRVHGHVKQGRLELDQPIGLPDGELVEVLVQPTVDSESDAWQAMGMARLEEEWDNRKKRCMTIGGRYGV